MLHEEIIQRTQQCATKAHLFLLAKPDAKLLSLIGGEANVTFHRILRHL